MVLLSSEANLEETWIYELCKDKSNQICCSVLDHNSSKRSWKLIRDIPPQCSKRKGIAFEVLGKRFYLLGGCGWFQDSIDEVYCYDTSKNSWDTNAAMSTARCYFACEALNKKIYAIGGIGSNSSDPLSWDTYDPCTNSWTFYSDPTVVADIEDFVVMDGKIYILCGASSTVPLIYIQLFMNCQTAHGKRGPCVVVDVTLYVLDETLGTRLMMWRNVSRECVALGRLSPLLTWPPCRLTAVGNCIYIIGKGLSRVVFDVGKVGNMPTWEE